jgi:hypothetical protein
MGRRAVIAAVLLVLAVVLTGVAVARKGLPWEFGQRSAVVLEVSGQAVLRLSSARMEREKLDKRLQPIQIDHDIYPGDRVQVGPLGFVRLSTKTGVVAFDTQSAGAFRIGLLEIARGRIELELYKPTQVRLEQDDGGPVTELSAGRYWASAGGGGFAVHVVEGEARRGELTAKDGQAIFVVGPDPKVISPADLPAPSTAHFVRDEDTLTGAAPAMTQIFVNGRGLTYPGEGGAFETRVPAGVYKAKVFVRDVFGRVALLEPGEPEPEPKPKPKKRRRRRRTR